MTNRFDSKNYVPVQENSFDFHAEHNGVQCIESTKLEDRGTERQFWFTRQMLREIFDVKSDNTITNHVETLVNRGVVDNVKNLTLLPSLHGLPTTLYDLKIFNFLVMRLDTDRAWEMKEKFNDVLVQHETGTTQTKCLPQDYESALEALLQSVREKKRLEAERDEAVRSKYHFVAGRDAKVCGELGGLRAQNEALRKQIGDSKKYKAVTAITWLPDYFDLSTKGLYGSLAHKLKKLEAEMPSEFAHIDIPDPRYGKVKAYHVGVIERLHEMVQADESLMEKYRKVSSLTVEA